MKYFTKKNLSLWETTTKYTDAARRFKFFTPSKKTINSAKLESELLKMGITIHVKYPCHVKPIPVGKPRVIESLWEPTKAYVKAKYLRRDQQSSKYLKEVTESKLINKHKSPNNNFGKLM